MADQTSKIEIEFDPKKLTPAKIKEISDMIVADLAFQAKRAQEVKTQGGISVGHTSHESGHAKSG